MIHLRFIHLVKSVSDLGPPGVLGIWGEWLFIFRELGSTGNYFHGFREQVHSFGDLGSPAKKFKKNLTLKEKPSFCLIFFKKILWQTPSDPPWISKCIYFSANMLIWIVLMTDKANYFHYCGKFDFKLLILRLIISY